MSSNARSTFGRRLSNFTQWTMQKIGRAEETKLDPEFVGKIHKFEATKKELQQLLKSATAFYNAKVKLQKANENFHDALAMTASHAKASAEAVSATQSYVTAGRSLDVEEKKFNEAYKMEIVDAIQALLEKEVQECQLAIKQHSTAHLEYDSSNRKWKKMNNKKTPSIKKSTQEEDLKTKAKAFNDKGHQVMNLTSIVEKKKNAILHQNLEKFMVAQHLFFEKASKYMMEGDTLKTQLDDIRSSEGKQDLPVETKKSEAKTEEPTEGVKAGESKEGETKAKEEAEAQGPPEAL